MKTPVLHKNVSGNPGNTFIPKKQLSDAYKVTCVSFYFQVKKNRTVIGKIIDVVRLLGKLNLPFRGRREDKNSFNKGVFKEFLEHIAKSDSLIEDHLRNSAGNCIIHWFSNVKVTTNFRWNIRIYETAL